MRMVVTEVYKYYKKTGRIFEFTRQVIDLKKRLLRSIF